jgi:hypothetical protein
MMTASNTLDFYVVYFPRSAGKYFVFNYEHMTDTRGTHVHEIEYLSEPNAISIIRNPRESIASAVASQLIRSNIDVNESIEFHFNEYVKTYNAILETDVPVLNFDDVVNNFDLVAKEIASILGHTVKYDFEDRRPQTTSDYVATSKTDERYNYIYSLVSEHRLIELCDKLYNEALGTCILY